MSRLRLTRGKTMFEKDSREFNLFKDYWDFCKKHWQVTDTDEWWEEATNEIRAYAKKYGNTRFVLDLSLAVMNHLERQVKGEGE